tara:strand:+ start:4555 stop:5640 length:1086 start_codon:yes stop_codon:yes gene_type:complete
MNLEYTFYRGRVALTAILKALKITSQDNVAIQAFTCLAVPEGVIASGAKPIYIDINVDNLSMCYKDLEKKINKNTKAIILQHTFGIIGSVDEIVEVAKKYNITIIEDCCHTHNSTHNNNLVGSFGSASFYSYEWGKPLVGGIGGSVETSDIELQSNLRNDYDSYIYPSFFDSSRINIQYFIFKILYKPKFYWPLKKTFHLLSKLGIASGNYNGINENTISSDFKKRMSKSIKNRIKRKLGLQKMITKKSNFITSEYKNNITNNNFTHLKGKDNDGTVYARYPLITDNKEAILAEAEHENIEIAGWYNSPIHPLESMDYKHVFYEKGMCDNAEKICKKVISLPVHYSVKIKDIERIVKFFNR